MWSFFDNHKRLACHCSGIVTGVYTTNSAELCEHIFSDCGARIVIVDGQAQLDKILKIRSKCRLNAIIQYNGEVKDSHDGLVKSVSVS
jgi:long-chain-fatty-acid--CoA ligase ACSBG